MNGGNKILRVVPKPVVELYICPGLGYYCQDVFTCNHKIPHTKTDRCVKDYCQTHHEHTGKDTVPVCVLIKRS